MRYCIHIVLFLLFGQAVGQNTTHRFEVELTKENGVGEASILSHYIVLPVHDDYSKREHNPDRKYLVLDTALNTIDQVDINIEFRQKFADGYSNDTALYQLFYDYRLGDFTLVAVIPGQETFRHEGRLPPRMFEPTILVFDENLWVVDHQPGKEKVVVYNFNSEAAHSLDISPKMKRSKNRELEFKWLDGPLQAVYCWQEESAKDCRTYIAVWDDEGELLSSHRLEHETAYKIQEISVYPVDESQYVMAGVMGNRSTSKSNRVFFGRLEDGSMTIFKTTPFSELIHYFDYLSKQQKKDMNRRIKRLKRHEKEFDVSVLAQVSPLVYMDNSFFLPVEVYSGVYTDQYGADRTYIDNSTTAISRTNISGIPQELRGYYYSHASLIRFDSFGDIKHDYFVSLNTNVTGQKRDKLLRLHVQADTLCVMYTAKNSTYRGSVKPRSFLKMELDSNVIIRPADVVEQYKDVFFDTGQGVDGQGVILLGFETRVTKLKTRQKENIYVIEKRKLR
ncbi:MAG: hypothetical protein JJ975_13690 [Bacteroidia bacterium]|nr:hypothetical protein [Bacteroidia bacterium]